MMPRAKAPVAVAEPPKGDGFTIAEALSLGEKPAPASKDDFEQNIGRGVMTSVMSGVAGIVERGMAGATRATEGGGGGGNSFKEALEIMKLMREAGLDGGGGGRGGSESSMASILKVLMEGQTSTTKLLMEMQSKAEERTSKLIEAMSKDNKEMLKELRDDLKKDGNGNSATDLLAKIGVQTIQGQMSRDPVAEFAHMKESLETVLGRPLTSSENGDIERELALERVKVERERIASEERRFNKDLESRQNMVGGALTALGSRRGDEEGGGDPLDSMPRFKCGACGEEFIMKRPRPQSICPACGVLLNTSGKAAPPPPDGQGGGTEDGGQSGSPPLLTDGQSPNQPQSEELGQDFMTDEGTPY